MSAGSGKGLRAAGRWATILAVLVVFVVAAAAAAVALRARPEPSVSSLRRPGGLVGSTGPSALPGGSSLPRVIVSPPAGPVGSTVAVEGDGFTGFWQGLASGEGYGLSMARVDAAAGCELIAPTRWSGTIDSHGHLTGSFVVPSEATCFQGGVSASHPVGAGPWTLLAVCHACRVGTFEVTAGTP